MALLLKGGAVFLHIPKTGGSWVAHVLEDCGLIVRAIAGVHKHIDLNRLIYYDKFYSEEGSIWSPRKRKMNAWISQVVDPKFVFCFVRHPLSWYESWWKFMSQPSKNWREFGSETDRAKWHPNSALNGLGDADFNTFVRNVITKRPGYVTELYGWYARPRVAFVGKQENLCEDLIRVLKQLDLDFSEDLIRSHEPVLASPNNEKVNWDPALREEVLRLEYATLVRHHYV